MKAPPIDKEIRVRELFIILFFCLSMRSAVTLVLQLFLLSPIDSLYYYISLIAQIAMFSSLIFLCVCQFKISSFDLIKFLKIENYKATLINGLLWGTILFFFTVGESSFETWAISQYDKSLAYRLWGFKSQTPITPISIFEFIPLIITGAIFAPAAEEFFFRGLLFRTIYARSTFANAALLSSIVFCALHYKSPHIISTLLFGVVICELYRRSDSLLLCFFVHLFFNIETLIIENFFRNLLTHSFADISNVSSWKFTFFALAISLPFLLNLAIRKIISKVS
jgi:membrane protease YdiL (CAAX protease family)